MERSHLHKKQQQSKTQSHTNAMWKINSALHTKPKTVCKNEVCNLQEMKRRQDLQ